MVGMIKEKAIKILKNRFVCDNCLGRVLAGQLLSGLTNKERGKIIRFYLAFLLDAGEKLEINLSNFYGIKFRNKKIKVEKPGKCFICKNFFDEKIGEIAKKIAEKLKKFEFNSFLIGTIVPDEILKAEEKIWETIGIENVESIKSEINRELGKKVRSLVKKKFDKKLPDITVIVDLENGRVSLQVRSLYVYGEYKKLKRGFPQAKWICSKCKGKGCIYCKGEGKLYKTSIQEIIEKPLLKATKAKKSAFHGGGREDIDARCLDWRPFVIEIKKPIRRKVNLRKIQAEINKSSKIKVRKLRLVSKDVVRAVKSQKLDKTYLAIVTFKRPIDKEKLKELKKLTLEPILQKTPLRVLHRRAKKTRKRLVKKISWEILGKKKLALRITAQSGLYIKELINGDQGRTKPSVAEILGNEVQKIVLDVVKIHRK